jgi:hypothetical protein
MTGKEYCRYIRTYSELEGLQRAHTVVYCAQTVPSCGGSRRAGYSAVWCWLRRAVLPG